MKSLLFILLFTISLAYGVEIKFIVSKTHSLLYFVNSISQNYAGDNLRLQFEASSANTHKNQAQIEEYRKLSKSIHVGYNVGNYPPKRYSGVKNLQQVLEIKSMQSNDLDDFSYHIAGLLPNDLHDKLLSILKYWEPIFNDLIWKPNLRQLQTYQEAIQKNSQKWQLKKLLEQTIHFLQAEWPDNIPFTVSLVPLSNRNSRQRPLV